MTRWYPAWKTRPRLRKGIPPAQEWSKSRQRIPSRRALATALGVSTRTVEAWEAGKNDPSGPARHLLYLLDGDHSLLERLTAR